MAGNRDKPEDIITKVRQVEVLQGQDAKIAEAVRQIGVTQQTYYRWRRECGGMNRDQLKRLKELGQENARLRRAVSDLTLDTLILSEAARGNEPPRVYRRVVCSMTRRLYRVSSGLHRTPPLLLRVGCIRWGRGDGGCYTSLPISAFPTRLRASISMDRSG
jgi:putative transposase